MTAVVFVIHRPKGRFWTDRGFDYAPLCDLLALACLVRGGGRYVPDRLLPFEP